MNLLQYFILQMEMKTGDEAANLNINVTPNPETELKPKDSQSACKVIVHSRSHMLSMLWCQLIFICQIKLIVSFLTITSRWLFYY